MILSHSDFRGMLVIPQIESLSVSEKLDSFIDLREDEVMVDIYGEDGYADLIAIKDIPEADRTPRQKLFFSQAIFIAACFVWYYYQREIVSYSTSSGTARGKSENAVNVDPSRKMVDVWNIMIDRINSRVTSSVVGSSCDLAQLDRWKGRRVDVRRKYRRINIFNL